MIVHPPNPTSFLVTLCTSVCRVKIIYNTNTTNDRQQTKGGEGE